MPILNSINQMQDEMKIWRQYLHQIPEIGLEEYKTSAYIKKKLKEWNIEFQDGYANTGIVAWVKGNKGNKKSIGLRADFDALPITEKNEFGHKSTNTGLMHACGHDGHTSMLLGSAKYLSENPNFDGDVYFIFQPGEEGFGGGEKMIRDGLFRDFNIDEVYALHNWPELPLGHFGVSTTGQMMAAVDEFDIIVKGKGGHAAFPHLVIDPIIIASQIVTAIQTIISRSTDPVDKALISITKIHGGTAHNVIDDEVKLSGTIRTFKPETRSFIGKKIEEISKGIAKAHGAEASIEFDLINKYPPTINSENESIFASNVAKELVGEDKVITDIEPSMGGEDFSYLLNEKPGSYLYIGQKDNDHKGNLHTNTYDFNDNLLPIGVNFWVNLVNKYFQ